MRGQKERTFNCPDCGVEVTTMYNRTLRCKECAKKRNAEQKKAANRRQNDKRRMNRAATEKPTRRNDLFHDSPEDIQKCLNCTRPKCGNCLSYMYTKKADRRKKDD